MSNTNATDLPTTPTGPGAAGIPGADAIQAGTLAEVAQQAANEALAVAREVAEPLTAKVLPDTVTRSLADYLSVGGNGWSPTVLPAPTRLSELLTGPDHSAPAVVEAVRERAAQTVIDSVASPDLQGVIAQSTELLRRNAAELGDTSAMRPAVPGPETTEGITSRKGRRALRAADMPTAGNRAGGIGRILGVIALVILIGGFIGVGMTGGGVAQGGFAVLALSAALPAIVAFILGLVGLASAPRGRAVAAIILGVIGNPFSWLLLIWMLGAA